jgi:uncharacterized protein DUF3618
MGEDPREDRQAVDTAERTPEQIEAEIERTRRELGDTVAAVAEKADVKAQARAKVEETKAQARAKVEETKARLKAKAPSSAGDGAGQVGRVASENRRPLVIGGAVLVAFLLGRAAGGRG